ncbi:MAG: hypothetical protein Q9180_009394 [Flavoplaca navasiana]
MQAAQKKTNVALYQQANFKRGQTGSQAEAFDMMMGTDLVSSMAYMLKDNAPTLGKKQISEIRCYPRTWNGQWGEEDVTITLKIDDVE